MAWSWSNTDSIEHSHDTGTVARIHCDQSNDVNTRIRTKDLPELEVLPSQRLPGCQVTLRQLGHRGSTP